MLYSYKCPAPGCDQTITIETNDEQTALEKLVKASQDHLAQSHPNWPIPNNLSELIKSQMNSNGNSSHESQFLF